MGAADDLEMIEVASRKELRSWLEAHHDQLESVWLITFKKTCGNKYLSYDEIVEEALCFGWVDSNPRFLDERRSMRLLSPRKSGSSWSRVNKGRIDSLADRGLMHVSGTRKVDAARADGSWSRLDSVEALEIPDDLNRALERVDCAAANFLAFPRSTKRAILEWILQARTAKTRASRIADAARLAGENVRVNQHRQPGKRYEAENPSSGRG